jgi:hypothetical protein
MKLYTVRASVFHWLDVLTPEQKQKLLCRQKDLDFCIKICNTVNTSLAVHVMQIHSFDEVRIITFYAILEHMKMNKIIDSEIIQQLNKLEIQ